jgi:hypothetical protein
MFSIDILVLMYVFSIPCGFCSLLATVCMKKTRFPTRKMWFATHCYRSTVYCT